MKNQPNIYMSRLRAARLRLRDFCAVYRLLNRRAELERLIRWAARKRLKGPRLFYERRKQDTEQRLWRYTMRVPQLARYARWLHLLYRLLFPPVRYPRKGAAGGYRPR